MAPDKLILPGRLSNQQTEIVDESKLAAAHVGFQTLFGMAMTTAPNYWRQLATEIQSSNASESYHWLGELPMLKEWIGERAVAQLRAHAYSIVNKDWAIAIPVNRNDIQDDNLGVVTPRIQQLGSASMDHYDELVFDLLTHGFDDTYGFCYDGQYFFDTDHRDDPDQASQSNKTTAALAEASFNTAYQTMTEYVTPEGRPLNIVPTHLITGPSLRVTAKNLLKEKNDAGADNVNAGIVQHLLAPRLRGAYANYWMLADLSRPLKPFILQIRQPIMLEQDQSNRFWRKTLYWGTDGRHNVGFGPWFTCYGSTGAA